MSKGWFRNGLWVALALLAEFFLLPQMPSGFYISVHVYFLLLIQLPVDVEKHLQLLVAFGLGLMVDQGLNTGGMHAAASVTAMFLRPVFIRAFGPREERGKPDYLTLNTFGVANYVLYVLCMVFVHHLFLTVLESFSLLSLAQMVLRIAGSTIVSLILYLALHMLTTRRAQTS
jgi:hypothetical protein